MLGQGSPRTRRRRHSFVVWLAAHLGVALAWIAAPTHAAEQAADRSDLRLRIAWGGGPPRIWEAKISVSEGTLQETRLLGLEADSPGALLRDDKALLIRPALPRSYDGVDVTVTGPLAATLTVDIAAVGDARTTQHIVLPLSKLIDETSETTLDLTKNKLVIRRAPGDRLRLRTPRDHMVFAPREKFSLEIAPHLVTLVAGEVIHGDVQLVTARSEDELWRTDKELLVAADGTLPALGPLDVDLPVAEGVYDLVVTLRRPPKNRYLGQKPTVITQRRVQLVVVDPAPPAAVAVAWQTVAEIDPANPKWWERLTRLPTTKMLPGFTKGPIEFGKNSRRAVGEKQYIQLEPQAWQAYPLAVARPGQPHILEVEYPPGVGQTLGISIVEPNSAGQVTPVGLDSGIDVGDDDGALASAVPHLHRLVFWPKTNSPLLLLSNRRDDRPAVFGRFRVFAGPAQLPSPPREPLAERRLVAAYFDRPLFPQNFSATDALDGGASRNLDDWLTFLEGATRLAEYLHYAGYNAAVVPVLHEGGTLYPSRELDATARQDTGIYFSTGQDPVQKDVLEVLLRVFDREGLRLIPAVQFSSPLPGLEQQRRKSGEEVLGLELVDSENKSWSQRNNGRRALGPIYNPLDPRVQAAMRRVTSELTARYQKHPAFGGIALQMGPETFSQLPGPDWGFDPQTLARFEAETKVQLPVSVRDASVARASFLLGAGQETWLAWRAAKLRTFHEDLVADLAATKRSDLRLYLATGDLLVTPAVQERLKPVLPRPGSLVDGCYAVGLDLARYVDDRQIVVLRPQRVAPQNSPSRRAASASLSSAGEFDTGFAALSVPGSLFFHEPLTLRLTSFEKQSPFGADKTNAYFVSQIPPSGTENRQRFAHSLASLDSQLVFDGGWLLPLGQEAALAPFLDAYRHLPAAKFQTVPTDPMANASPAVLRTFATDKGTWLYAVNDSPWPVTVDLELAGPENLAVTLLAGRSAPPLVRRGAGYVWQLTLEPYDLIASFFSAPGVTVTRWQGPLPPVAVEEIRQKLRGVRERAGILRDPPSLTTLTNNSFELPLRGADIPGWVYKRAIGLTATCEAASPAHSGKQALHLKSDGGVLWVRSTPFEQPRSGRLALKVWLRREDTKEQPPLRLAIEGRAGGQTYYRFATVGAGSNDPLGSDWTPFVFQVDDLPPQGLTDLRVGFDLMGAGDVWIDDAQVYDLWFFKSERDELFKLIALADFQFSQGQVIDCHRFLESYWPQFLLAHVPLQKEARLAALPDRPRMLAPLDQNNTDGEKPPTLLDRMKGLVPRVPSFY